MTDTSTQQPCPRCGASGDERCIMIKDGLNTPLPVPHAVRAFARQDTSTVEQALVTQEVEAVAERIRKHLAPWHHGSRFRADIEFVLAALAKPVASPDALVEAACVRIAEVGHIDLSIAIADHGSIIDAAKAGNARARGVLAYAEAALSSPRPVDEVREARASVLSEWTDRPMLVGGCEFQAGQITVADVLDHAARSYAVKQETRAGLARKHEWNEGRPGYGVQCKHCGTIASYASRDADCPRRQALASLEGVSDGQ